MNVSVVMPVHGNWPVVRRALEALDENAGDHELIVVDDGSPDDTSGRLRANLKAGELIENRESRGFGAACNQGANLATRRVVCFLNSDAVVEEGALAALEKALEVPEVGAAAPLLLNEDGSLQEAGGAVGREGSTYPLGRGGSAGDAAWVFRREIDYGSAACLAVRRSAFQELSGFDQAYAPAYYEDVDLCFRLARLGLRTILEPKARIRHLQYGSGSVERARILVEQNRRVFLERWSERLAHRPLVSGDCHQPHRLIALRDAIALVRFLVFDDESLAVRLSNEWPRTRVTLVGRGNGSHAGIECVSPPDLAGWLHERQFHYWAVFGNAPGADEALRKTQPQAVRVSAEPDELVAALASVGIAPPGEEPLG